MVRSKLEEVVQGLTAALDDASKFECGNDAAGARVRAALQTAVTSCKDLRAEIQTIRNERKA